MADALESYCRPTATRPCVVAESDQSAALCLGQPARSHVFELDSSTMPHHVPHSMSTATCTTLRHSLLQPCLLPSAAHFHNVHSAHRSSGH